MMSGLIQMNAHMVMSGGAVALIVAGAMIAMGGLLWAVALGVHGRPGWIVMALGFALGLALMITGARMPRDRIITACASGPVSLESVGAVYDIVEVDGKMLRLRER